MKVEWNQCKNELPSKDGHCWISGSPRWLTKGIVGMAYWEQPNAFIPESGYWWIGGRIFRLDHPHAPTHWAYAEQPDPPEEEDDA